MFLLSDLIADALTHLLMEKYGDNSMAMVVITIVLVTILIVLIIMNCIKKKVTPLGLLKIRIQEEKEKTKDIDWMVENGYRVIKSDIKEKIKDIKRKRKRWKDGI